MRVATAAPDGLHTREDAEVLIDFGDAGVLSGRRDSPQSRPPSEAAPSRSQCGPTLGTFVGSTSSRRYNFNSRSSLKGTGTASGNTCLRQVGGPHLGATVAPTALREPRAHSSTVRTFGWGRDRHSSARTLTTDRAPLSLPPRTSVESDPRLNRSWVLVSSLRAFIIATIVEPGNNIGLNTSWALSATALPMLSFTKATEMDLLVSCMGSRRQVLHYASVIIGHGLRTRSHHRHRHRTTSTA